MYSEPIPDLYINNELVHQQEQRFQKLLAFVKDAPEMVTWLENMTTVTRINIQHADARLNGETVPPSLDNEKALVIAQLKQTLNLNDASEIILRNAGNLFRHAQVYSHLSKALSSRLSEYCSQLCPEEPAYTVIASPGELDPNLHKEQQDRLQLVAEFNRQLPDIVAWFETMTPIQREYNQETQAVIDKELTAEEAKQEFDRIRLLLGTTKAQADTAQAIVNNFNVLLIKMREYAHATNQWKGTLEACAEKLENMTMSNSR